MAGIFFTRIRLSLVLTAIGVGSASDAERAALSNHLGFIARIAGACGGVPCVFGAPGARDPGALAPEAALEGGSDIEMVRGLLADTAVPR